MQVPSERVAVKVGSFEKIVAYEDMLLKAIQNGPVSVVLNYNDSLKQYRKGTDIQAIKTSTTGSLRTD